MQAVITGCLSLAVALMLASLIEAQEPLPAGASPSSPREQLKREADTAYRQKDYVTTIRLTSQVLTETANDAVAQYLRGSARVELGIARQDAGLVREGVDDARQAIQSDGAKNPDYYLPYLYGMSHLTALEGEPNHARTAVSEATKLLSRTNLSVSARSNVLYQRALAHAKLEDHGQAAQDLRETVQLAPDHLAARMALGEALLKAGDLQASEQAYTTATEQFPDNPLVFNNRGMFYQVQQRNGDAIADFSRALELNPNHLEACLNRGFTRLNSGDAAGAQADFTHAIEIKPDHAPAYSLRATAKLLQQQAMPALHDYLKVIELRPSYAPARADIGFAYFFAQHFDTAAQAFEQAMILDPDAKYLIPWRYASLSLAGRQDAGNQAFQATATKPAEDRDWFDLLTLFLMGKLEEQDLLASIDAEAGQLRDAQLCEAYYFMGLRLQRDGRGDPAQYFRRAVEAKATQLSAYRAAQFELDRLQR